MRATSSIRSTSRVTSPRRSGGHGDLQAVVGASLDLEVERLQDLALARARRRARRGSPARAPRAGGCAAGPGSPAPGRRRSCRATTRGAAQLDHQARRDRLRLRALLGREALLEARGGLAAQPERPRGAVDVGAVPVRDLEQHARRALAHLRARAAHQPGDRGRALGVLDHDHLRRRACASGRRASAPARPRARGAPSAAPPATRSRSKACSGWPVSSIT